MIVGVSTDDVVKQYKNKKPIIPFEERFKIVEAIKYVDRVVPQTSMDKYLAWEKLHYDILFHGSDWKGTAMYNEIEKKLNDVGVKIVFFDYTQGTSSTELSKILHKMTNNESNNE